MRKFASAIQLQKSVGSGLAQSHVLLAGFIIQFMKVILTCPSLTIGVPREGVCI